MTPPGSVPRTGGRSSIISSVLVAVAALAIAALTGPLVGVAAALLILVSALLIGSGRALPLVLLPACVLVPQNLRVHLSGLPDMTVQRWMILLCVAQVALESTGKDGSHPQIDRRIRSAMLAFTALVILSYLTTHLPDGINRGLALTLELFLPMWLVSRRIRTRDDLHLLVRAILTIAAVACAIGIMEFGFQRLLAPPSLRAQFLANGSVRNGFVRSESLFPHSIVFGSFLDMILPLAGCCALGRSHNRRLGTVVLGMALLALLFTLSRGPWLAGLFALLILVAAIGGGRATRLILISALVIGLVLVSPLQPTISSLMGGLTANEAGPAANSVLYRQQLLHDTIDFAKHHPLGGGVGSVSQLRLPAYINGRPLNLATSIDNTYAILIFEIGPVGLAMFGLVMVRLLLLTLATRRRAEADSHDRLVACALLSSMAALLVVAVTVATLTWDQISLLFSCLTGMSLGLARLVAEPQEARPSPQDPLRRT